MILNIVEGTLGIQGTVSGTDQTVLALTNHIDHTAPNVLRVWIENPTGGTTAGVTSLNTVTGTVTIVGADGIDILTNTAAGVITSGILQSQINTAISDAAEPAIVGDLFISVTSGTSTTQLSAKAILGEDGITVISGSNSVTVSGFRDEFVLASGSLQSQISGLDPAVTLQEAYDDGDGTIISTFVKPVTVSGLFTATSGSFDQSLTVSGVPVLISDNPRWYLYDVSASGTTVETDLINIIVPANTIGPQESLFFDVFSEYWNTSGSRSLFVNIYLGGDTLYSDNVAPIFSAPRARPLRFEGRITNLNSGVRQNMSGSLRLGASGPTVAGIGDFNSSQDTANTVIASSGTISVNTTVDQTFRLSVQHGDALTTLYLDMLSARIWIGS
jgi:hypothetical protein